MGIIGSQIKPFTATAFQAGKDFFDVTDEDVKGKWAVFFFYPADFTFVCPTELEDLGEQYAMLQKMDVEVYGVSTDTHFSHKAWHDTSEKIGKLQLGGYTQMPHTLQDATYERRKKYRKILENIAKTNKNQQHTMNL